MGKFLIDNKEVFDENKKNKSLYSFLDNSLLNQNNKFNGTFHIVTGYTTIGMLSKLYDLFEKNNTGIILKYEIILGDLTSIKDKKEKSLKLLKDVSSILDLPINSEKAIRFLELNKVVFKTLEPEFCHGKVYIFRQAEEFKEINKSFLIIGSSNLTERGLGFFPKSNFELNIVFDKVDYESVYLPLNKIPSNPEFSHSFKWFQNLWTNESCYDTKTIKDSNNISLEKTINQYLIEEIKKDFAQPKTPKEVYLKIIYELYKNDNQDIQITERSLGKLENSSIFKSLYSFQEKGAISLIKILKKYNCAILGDAVGLGKTWIALSVIKFFRIEGYQVILFVPKRLRNNWEQYLPNIDGKINHGAKFVEDNFDFVIKNHTDLTFDLIEDKKLTLENYFQKDFKKLIVIDESHNFRNSESKKYQFLLEEIIKKNDDIKVLMLSATPINTGLSDISNQFMLGLKSDNKSFEDLGIKNLNDSFNIANEKYKKWLSLENRTIKELIDLLLPTKFLNITESLIVARTREMIKRYLKDNSNENLKFIENIVRKNFNISPENISHLATFEDIYNSLPKYFAAYKSSDYLRNKNLSMESREKSLVEMLNMLLVKRLESSWKSFLGTVNKMIDFHIQLLGIITKVQNGEYQNTSSVSGSTLFDYSDIENETDNEEVDTLIDGIKVETVKNIRNIEDIELFKTRVIDDCNSLKYLKDNLERFEKSVNQEIQNDNKLQSIDNKLNQLIEIIEGKQNKENKKVIIFTVYKDTADYLFLQLLQRGFKKLAKVTGSDSRTSYNPEVNQKNFEPILQAFAPYTKLFLEKDYLDFEKDKSKSLNENYTEWKKFISNNSEYILINQTLEQDIDILIATDCLSEGQNLQDSDMVINYDIHWNPVRLIQRMGRIDRIGSLNNTIYGYSFLPADSLESYLNLRRKVKDRMVSMAIAGSEADTEIIGSQTDDKDKDLYDKQFLRMSEQMKSTLGEVSPNEDKSVTLSNLSIENFKNDLSNEMQERLENEKELPDGIYSGFDIHNPNSKNLIALLRRKYRKDNRKKEEYHLLYLDKDSNEIIKDKNDILRFLQNNRNNDISNYIKNISRESINEYSNILKNWIEKQTNNQDFVGNSQMDFLNQLSNPSLRTNENISEIKESFKYDNFELVCWLVVS